MKAAFLATVLVATTLSTTAFAADHANGVWGILSLSDRILNAGTETRWRYGFDAHWRYSERGAGSDVYVLRPSLGYDLKPNATFWAGYGYFLTDPETGSNRYEHRWWQQFAWTAKRWDWGTLSLRTRLEERDIEGSQDVGLRFRQQLQMAMPLPNESFTLITAIEHYSNMRDTDWGARSGFDQLRSYVGLRKRMTAKLTLEVGYANHWLNRTAEDSINHVVRLALRTQR